MSDSLDSSYKLRPLNVIDGNIQEALSLVVTTSIAAISVIRTLEQLIDWRGKPKTIPVDNRPEFTSPDFTLWCKKEEFRSHYIQPGKPMQNGYIERFNGSYCREILDIYLFFDLEEIRQLTQKWIEHYNTQWPHVALDNLPPKEWPLKKKVEIWKTWLCTKCQRNKFTTFPLLSNGSDYLEICILG